MRTIITTIGIGILSLSAMAPVAALRWDIQPSVSAETTYTSNAELARPDQDPETSFINSVSPSLSVRGDGPKVDAALAYQLRHERVGGEVEHEATTDHQYSTAIDSEWMRDRLFMSARASRSQTLEDSSGRLLVGDSASRGDDNTVSTLELNPRWRQGWGSLAKLLADYRYTEVENELSTANDSYTHALEAQLLSSEDFALVWWSVDADTNREFFDDNSEVILQSLNATLGYRVSSQWSVFGQAGYEDNEYTRNVEEQPEGETWSVGGVWRPSSRTSAQFSRGHRFFGSTWSLNANHRLRRSLWSLSYTESLTTSNQEKVSDNRAAGDAALEDIEQPLELEGFDRQFAGTNEVYVQQRWALSMRLVGRRNQLRLTGSTEHLDGEVTGLSTRTVGVRAEWSRNVGARTQVITAAQASYLDVFNGGVDNQLWSTSVALDHALGKRVSARGKLGYTEFDITTGVTDYRETQATVSLQAQF